MLYHLIEESLLNLGVVQFLDAANHVEELHIVFLSSGDDVQFDLLDLLDRILVGLGEHWNDAAVLL